MEASEGLDAAAESRSKFSAMVTRKAWEDEAFRQRLLADPKAAIAELLGEKLPDGLQVTVHEENAGALHFVIPARPAARSPEDLSDADLQLVAGGIGPVPDRAPDIPIVSRPNFRRPPLDPVLLRPRQRGLIED
jgi:hypothetical protein